jgi:MtN3 and saliva related transmembrane protein
MKRGGLHHLHKRKRNQEQELLNLEQSPGKKKYILMLDKLVLSLAVIAPLFEIPQLFEIYAKKAAENVSIITWGFFALMAIPWFIYGIVHKEKPIIILYLLWFLIDSTIVIGILMYS